MSYRSRVYRHRDAHTHDEAAVKPFFSKQHDDNNKSSKKSFFQAKLAINKPGDSYEREADAVANAVVNKPKQTPVVQQKEISCVQRLSTSAEDEKKKGVKKKEEPKKEEDKLKGVQIMSADPEKDKKDKVQKKEEPEKEKEKMKGVQKKDEPKKEEDKLKGVQKMSADPEKDKKDKVQKKEDPEKEKMKGIQKKDDPKKEEEKTTAASHVQKKSEAGESTTSEQLAAHIEKSAGKGNPLPEKILLEMNKHFGVDFSNVRMHTDSEAAAMNDELNAQAFTHGNDIYFNEGKYNPESPEGKSLLAHELTHVVQQG